MCFEKRYFGRKNWRENTNLGAAFSKPKLVNYLTSNCRGVASFKLIVLFFNCSYTCKRLNLNRSNLVI